MRINPFVEARTALIRRGLDLDTREALNGLSAASLAALRHPRADPLAIQAEVVEQAKAIIHLAAVNAALS